MTHPHPSIWDRLTAHVEADPTPGEQRLAGAVQHAQSELRVADTLTWIDAQYAQAEEAARAARANRWHRLEHCSAVARMAALGEVKARIAAQSEPKRRYPRTSDLSDDERYEIEEAAAAHLADVDPDDVDRRDDL